MKPKDFFDAVVRMREKQRGIFQDQDKFSPNRKQET